MTLYFRKRLGKISLTRFVYRKLLKIKAKREIKKVIKANKELNIKIGAGYWDKQKNWIITNIETINLIEERSWSNLIPRHSVNNIFAEHVFEHLTFDEGRRAIENCLKFLKKGGHIRIAVPDANHPSKFYIEHSKPLGLGYGSEDHKIFYNYDLVNKLLDPFQDKIKIEFKEFFDENGLLHTSKIDNKKGVIKRTVKNNRKLPDSEFPVSSLIFDIKLISELSNIDY